MGGSCCGQKLGLRQPFQADAILGRPRQAHLSIEHTSNPPSFAVLSHHRTPHQAAAPDVSSPSPPPRSPCPPPRRQLEPDLTFSPLRFCPPILVEGPLFARHASTAGTPPCPTHFPPTKRKLHRYLPVVEQQSRGSIAPPANSSHWRRSSSPPCGCLLLLLPAPPPTRTSTPGLTRLWPTPASSPTCSFIPSPPHVSHVPSDSQSDIDRGQTAEQNLAFLLREPLSAATVFSAENRNRQSQVWWLLGIAC